MFLGFNPLAALTTSKYLTPYDYDYIAVITTTQQWSITRLVNEELYSALNAGALQANSYWWHQSQLDVYS